MPLAPGNSHWRAAAQRSGRTAAIVPLVSACDDTDSNDPEILDVHGGDE